MQVSCMCLVKVWCVSRLSPRILLLFEVGSVVPWILRLSLVWCSCGSGVKRVICVLLGLMLSLFCAVHVCICSRYGCSVASACLVCVWEEVMVMSSAYTVSVMLGMGGGGMSAK